MAFAIDLPRSTPKRLGLVIGMYLDIQVVAMSASPDPQGMHSEGVRACMHHSGSAFLTCCRANMMTASH